MGKISKMTLKNKYKGIITASSWDEAGKISRISLNALNEKEYIIKKSKQSEELMSFIQNQVEITGKVEMKPDGKLYIKVTNFKCIKSYDDDDN